MIFSVLIIATVTCLHFYFYFADIFYKRIYWNNRICIAELCLNISDMKYVTRWSIYNSDFYSDYMYIRND